MKHWKTYFILCLILIAPQNICAQLDQKIKHFQYPANDTLKIDTTSILNFGFEISTERIELDSSQYELYGLDGYLVFKTTNIKPGTPLTIKYYQQTINFGRIFQHKPDSLIFVRNDTIPEYGLYSLNNTNSEFDFFSESQLNKQGSISRGVSVGNAQSLSFQSTLNLQLNGKIGPDLFIKGSISDDNIPFQPDGNTQKLQEFDQVYLQIYNDDFSVAAGDFWLQKPAGYFLNYQKRSQGLSIDFKHSATNIKSKPIVTHKISGAFSKGKFSRRIIQGIEGNQGPYRLFGANNEQNIIILAGTEKVYIDGILLKRGQAYDYIIDYNGAEITFTANQFITKDKRIIVEFQYSDLNYARSLIAYNTTLKTDKYELWGNIYNEQDAKNQPIQQGLDLLQKQSLSLAGDSIENAFISSIYLAEYSENSLHYYLTDSLGIDSILVFTNHKDSAEYNANFALVGNQKGNYVVDKYTANGKIYRWVAPENGIPQGNYEPIQLLVPPKQNQMITAGGKYQFNENMFSELELAYSKNDLNTFSDLDKDNDRGFGIKWALQSHKRFKKNNSLTTKMNFEYNDQYFTPIQWFRSAEFDRDWNVRQKNYSGNQFISSAALLYGHKAGKISYRLNQLTWGNNYAGWKNDVGLFFDQKGYYLNFEGNYLFSDGIERTNYLRHKTQFSKTIKKVKFGINDIFERNNIFLNDSIQNSSFQFYDIKPYVSFGDSTRNAHEIYYRQRHDWFSDSTQLKHAAQAHDYGISSKFYAKKNHQLNVNINYRQLTILDSSLINQQPEQSILGRAEQNLYLWKGALTSRLFYELNSGLELKRDFIYIQVNNGQGVYTWIDYNNDNIKDIGEFEIAQFPDQAEYIRINISTTDFIRTYGNQFTQTFFLKPERIWQNKKGVKKILALFSNQTNYSFNRKTSYEKGFSALNPFKNAVADTNLINSHSSFRNTVFFNRLNPIFGMEYNYQLNYSKNLLTSGFDANNRLLNTIKLRWTFSKVLNLRLEYNKGSKGSQSDYATLRNFDYTTESGEIVLAYQPNTSLRIAASGEYALKTNQSDLKETAELIKLGGEFRLNKAKKGSLSANLSSNFINYNSASNTPLAFELLEALKPGVNYIWGLSYQRKIANNLQLNFNYNGRKSEDVKTIHSGGMELRAFF